MDDVDETDFEGDQEQQAAAEAGAIGGASPDPLPEEHRDDADLRPVYEAGGGEQDGFELAESDLIRNASHDDGTALPLLDRFPAEQEADRADIEHAEADDVPLEDA